MPALGAALFLAAALQRAAAAPAALTEPAWDFVPAAANSGAACVDAGTCVMTCVSPARMHVSVGFRSTAYSALAHASTQWADRAALPIKSLTQPRGRSASGRSNARWAYYALPAGTPPVTGWPVWLSLVTDNCPGPLGAFKGP